MLRSEAVICSGVTLEGELLGRAISEKGWVVEGGGGFAYP